MKSAAVMFLSSGASYVSLVFMAGFAKDDLGVTALEVGLIAGFFNFTYLMASYLLGRWADMHGRRYVLLSGLLASAGAALTQAFAFDSLSLAISRGLVGFAGGAFPAALLTYAQETREKMGRFSSYGSLGWGVFSQVAGLLGIYWQIFALSAALFFAGFLVALLMPFGEEMLVSVPRFPKAILKKNVAIYAAMLIRHTGANAAWVLFTPFMIESLHFDLLQVGAVYAINPIFQFIIMQTTDKFRSIPLVYVGLIFSMLGFLAMGLATDFPQMMMTQLLIGVSWAALYVGSVKFIMERNIERATAAGLLNSTIGISSLAGPLIGGTLVTVSLVFGLPQDLAYRTTFYAASIMALLALAALPYINGRRTTAASAS